MSWKKEKERLGKELIGILYDHGMIKTWYRDRPEGWTLVSGIWSPFYIQLRPLSSYPNSRELLSKVGIAMGKMIEEEVPQTINKLVGVAVAGIPIAVATTIFSGIPSCYTRKLEGIKTTADLEKWIQHYGEHSLVEGELKDGDVIAIVDDLVTKFDTKILAIEQIKHEVKRREKQTRRRLNVTCESVVVIIDREQGAAEVAKNVGIGLYSLIPFKSKGLWWLKGKMTEEEYKVIRDYLEDAGKYQYEEIKKELRQMALKANH
jgi:orotate phosphoribosyltransferase